MATMDWGMANRLSKTIKEDGRCFYLAMDHGYFQGPTHCLEEPGKAAEPLLPYVDALFMTRGVVRAVIPPNMQPALILRVSGGNSMVGDDLANEELTTSIDDIIRINAAAVGFSVYIGSQYEHQTLMALSDLVNECTVYGIPVMAVTAVGRETQKMEARYLALACRICAELVHGYNPHPAWDEASCHACYLHEELNWLEGIIPALESAHAIAECRVRAPRLPKDALIIVSLSGRGDKDVAQAAGKAGLHMPR